MKYSSKKSGLNDGQKNKLLLGCLMTFLGAIIFCDYYFLGDVGTNRFALAMAFYLFLVGLAYSSFTLFPLLYRSVIGRFMKGMIGIICVLILHHSIGLREGMTNQAFVASVMVLLAALGAIASIGAIIERIIAGKFKGKDITEDNVNYQSDKAALKALGGVSILILVFGWLTYNYMDGAKTLFTSNITITMVVLFAAGIASFYWGAKNNFVRIRQTEEQITDGKRQDARDTAQLIAESSRLISSQADYEKVAGIRFLRQIALDNKSEHRYTASDLLIYFISAENDKTEQNLPRMNAIVALNEISQVLSIGQPQPIQIVNSTLHSGILDLEAFRFLPIKFCGYKWCNRDIVGEPKWFFENCQFENCTIHSCNGAKFCFQKCLIISVTSFKSAQTIKNNRYMSGEVFLLSEAPVKAQFTGYDFSYFDGHSNVGCDRKDDNYYYTDQGKHIPEALKEYLNKKAPKFRDNSILIGAQ